MTRADRSRGALPESMLDLIWILLFYFLMISTVRTAQTPSVLIKRVPYRQTGGVTEIEEKRAVGVTITGDGEVLLLDQPVDTAGLAARIKEMSLRSRQPIVLVAAVDRDARVEELLLVEDAAREAGVELVIHRTRAKKKASGLEPAQPSPNG